MSVEKPLYLLGSRDAIAPQNLVYVAKLFDATVGRDREIHVMGTKGGDILSYKEFPAESQRTPIKKIVRKTKS